MHELTLYELAVKCASSPFCDGDDNVSGSVVSGRPSSCGLQLLALKISLNVFGKIKKFDLSGGRLWPINAANVVPV